MDRKSASNSRKRIKNTNQELTRLIERIILYRKPMIQGRLKFLRTKCGKINCKCTRGEKHTSSLLYITRGGPLKKFYINKNELPTVRENTRRYKSFRDLRSEINKAFNLLTMHINELEASLTETFKKGAAK